MKDVQARCRTPPPRRSPSPATPPQDGHGGDGCLPPRGRNQDKGAQRPGQRSPSAGRKAAEGLPFRRAAPGSVRGGPGGQQDGRVGKPARCGSPCDSPSGGPGLSLRPPQQPFVTLVAELASWHGSRCAMGPALVQVARTCDDNGKTMLGWFIDADELYYVPFHTQLLGATKPLRKRRLWSLPLSEVSLRSPTMRGVVDAMSFSDQAGARAWFGLIVMTICTLWCGETEYDRSLARRGPATVAQTTALERLLGVCSSLVVWDPGGAKVLDVAEGLKACATNDDTVNDTARTLALVNLVKALPLAGVDVSIPAAALGADFTLEALLVPGRVRRVEEEKTEGQRPPRKRIA